MPVYFTAQDVFKKCVHCDRPRVRLESLPEWHHLLLQASGFAFEVLDVLMSGSTWQGGTVQRCSPSPLTSTSSATLRVAMWLLQQIGWARPRPMQQRLMAVGCALHASDRTISVPFN